MPNRIHLTYIEDVKDLEKVTPPSYNLALIALRVKNSGSHVPLTLLDDTPLDLGHGSAMKTSTSGSFGVRICRSGSRSQLFDSTYYGVAECIQLCPFQSPVKSLTNLTASPSKVDVILINSHRVLGAVCHEIVFAE